MYFTYYYGAQHRYFLFFYFCDPGAQLDNLILHLPKACLFDRFSVFREKKHLYFMKSNPQPLSRSLSLLFCLLTSHQGLCVSCVFFNGEHRKNEQWPAVLLQPLRPQRLQSPVAFPHTPYQQHTPPPPPTLYYTSHITSSLAVIIIFYRRHNVCVCVCVCLSLITIMHKWKLQWEGPKRSLWCCLLLALHFSSFYV